tara:strand:+ start:851 stop:1537 length:687 start_codon:yes stop_codon:yes gene_type:complete
MKKNKISQAEKLLISAYELSKVKKIFSAEDLTVKSWKLYPEDFSLMGYKGYPNSNQIYTFVMGKDGALIKKGWVKKVGQKQYVITDTGSYHVESELLGKKDESSSTKIKPLRDMGNKISVFLRSDITQKILKSESLEKVSFEQICGFWGISTNVNFPTLNEKFIQINTWIKSLTNQFKKTDKYINIDGKLSITKKQLKSISEAQVYFEKKFKKEIDYIKIKRPKPVNN